MLRFVKGALRRLSTKRDAQAPKRITGLRRRGIWLTGSLQGEDQTDKFLGSVGDSDVVVFPLSAFLCEIGSEGVIPDADVLCSIVECVTKVTGTALFHMSIGVVQLA